MPSSPNYVRNLKQEAKTAKKRGETGVGHMSKDAIRHRARRAYIAAHGEAAAAGKDIDHKHPLKSGGSATSLANLRARSVHSNRSAGGKSGNSAGKAAGARKGHRLPTRKP